MHERGVATTLLSGHSAGDALASDSDPPEHFGRDGSRFDNNDLHSKRLNLSAQCIADCFERELRACVRTIGGHRDLAAHGADVDHATLVADQGWQECLDNGDVAEEVHLEQASPLVDG